MKPLLSGFGFGVAVFAHVVARGLGDAEVRRLLGRVVLPQIAVTLALALVCALVLPRVPLFRLGEDLLPVFVWEKNRATIVLCAAFVLEWIVAWLWPRRGAALVDRLAVCAGLESAPVAHAAQAEVTHRLRTLGPLLVVCAAWTAALVGASWVGLQALESRASDPMRLAITAVVGALLMILPVVPLLGTWVWFVADRVARADVTEGARGADVLRTHAGEALGLALVAAPGALPITFLLWRPFILVSVSLLRRARVASSMALPAGLKPDPIADLREQLRLGAALIKSGTLEPPPRSGRVLRLLWAPALISATMRAVWLDPVTGPRARRVFSLQLLLTLVFGLGWIVVFGFDLGSQEHRLGGGTLKISFGATAVAAAFSLLHLVEGVVIALSREHHDRISAEASRLVGVPPDEDVPDPRVRFDRRWAWTRIKRRAQGAIILVASALPWVILVFLATLPVVEILEDAVIVGWFLSVAVGAAGNAVMLLFGLYWGAVFLIGKTGHAWKVEPAHEPFFLVALERTAERWPRAAWPIALYLWVVRRTLGLVPRPAALMERMPLESVGLALVRIACVVPGVYIVLRPFLPVGAALLLKHRAPECLEPAAAPVGAADPIAASSGHSV